VSNPTPSLLPTHGVDPGGVVRVGSARVQSYIPSLLPTHGVNQGGVVRVEAPVSSPTPSLLPTHGVESGWCSQSRERPCPIKHPAYCLHMG
jgi:hypothetical protein